MQSSFSIEGDHVQKVALVRHAIQKFGLSLPQDFASFFGDVIKFGRNFEGSIVGQPGNRILMVGGRESTSFVLPGDYEKALEAIGKFFQKL